jgi:hypothetical protein
LRCDLSINFPLERKKEWKIKKASVEVTFDNFFAWMNWYMELLDKIYFAKRVISKSEEKREIYEAFVLRIHAIWEIFVESLLVDCLNKDTDIWFGQLISIRQEPSTLLLLTQPAYISA